MIHCTFYWLFWLGLFVVDCAVSRTGVSLLRYNQAPPYSPGKTTTTNTFFLNDEKSCKHLRNDCGLFSVNMSKQVSHWSVISCISLVKISIYRENIKRPDMLAVALFDRFWTQNNNKQNKKKRKRGGGGGGGGGRRRKRVYAACMVCVRADLFALEEGRRRRKGGCQ